MGNHHGPGQPPLMGDKVDPRREYIISHAEFNKKDTFEQHAQVQVN